MTSDNLVFSTGDNSNGQLGLGDFISISIPKPLNLSNIEKISVGFSHSIVLSDGIAYSFGKNNYGQLGLFNHTLEPVNIPKMIKSNEKFRNVITAFDYSILFTNTRIFSFGDNQVKN